MNDCPHKNVRTFSRISRPASREEPEEYDEWAECLDCGETISIEDIPEDAEEEEGEVEPHYCGAPSEFYD